MSDELRAEDIRWRSAPRPRLDPNVSGETFAIGPLPAGGDAAMSDDYRELVITDLADENALLRERIASLEADVDDYRALVSSLLDAVQAWRADPAKEKCREYAVVEELRPRLLAVWIRLSEER
jgi:hypothetical protein